VNRIGKALREREDRHSPVYRRDTDMKLVDMLIVIAAFSFLIAWMMLG
jgi:hypothetical protein